MALTSEFRVKLSASQISAHDVASGRFAPSIESVIQLASGVGANQADILYVDAFSIAASSTGNLDLAGVLTDAFGATITGVELVAIIVLADSTNVNNVNVGGAASNQVPFLGAVTDKVPVHPGGAFALVAPNAAGQCTITAATGDQLGLANSGGTTAVTGTIGLLLRTA